MGIVGNIRYFGTDLKTAGHFIWQKADEHLNGRSLEFGGLGIDPDSYPKPENGYYLQKGTMRYYYEKGYSILAIEGSPADDRPESKCVWFIKGEVSQEELLLKVKEVPVYQRILDYFKRYGFNY